MKKNEKLKNFQKKFDFFENFCDDIFESRHFSKKWLSFSIEKKITFLKNSDFEKCHRIFFRKNRTFLENFRFFMFWSYFIPNLWKFHCATPSTSRARPKTIFFSHFGKIHIPLDQKSLFFSHFGKIPIPTFCQCSLAKLERR